MAFTVDHAKTHARRLCAGEGEADRADRAPELLVRAGLGCLRVPEAGTIGQDHRDRCRMYRNTPHGKPQWSRPVYPDMTPENILWNTFLGERRRVPFDANRYINWRFFWDYSGGNVYENMCHQLAFWYKVLDLRFPTRSP